MRDFWRGDITLRQLRALIAGLPDTSMVHRLQTDGKVWTWRDHMAWFEIKMIDRLTLVIAKGLGVKSVKSLELPDFPWEESKAAVRKYGDRGGTDSAEVIGFLDSLTQ